MTLEDRKYRRNRMNRMIVARTHFAKQQSKEELREILKKAIENTNKINHKCISHTNTSS